MSKKTYYVKLQKKNICTFGSDFGGVVDGSERMGKERNGENLLLAKRADTICKLYINIIEL